MVIVAHDSAPELEASLPALVGELSADDELVVVDNASADPAALGAVLSATAPRGRTLRLPVNRGFAGGANAGAEAARGDLLVLLNPDATVTPGWAAAIRAPWGGPWAAWQGLVLLADGTRINTSGGVLHFTGLGWAGQIDAPVGLAPREPASVGFLSGACLAIPRERFLALGGFSAPFFMYCEDVDLSLRVRLAGGRIGVVPGARVAHDYAFVKGAAKWHWLERNRWATILRTYPARLLALLAPALAAAEVAIWVTALRGGWASGKARASLDTIRDLPRLLAERRAIQEARTIDAREFAAGLTAELSSPYLGAIAERSAIATALRGYWRGVCALL